MKNLLLILLGLLSLGLVGCSSSRIVLLDTGKTENSIVVRTEGGELILDQPNTYTDLTSAKTKPAPVKTIERQELQHRYRALFSSAPKPPRRFLLYFDPGTTTITAASKQLFAPIEKAIKERIPCDVNIIGHADRTGSREYNTELSLKRARVVYKWLLGKQLDIEKIVIESYGEEDPLVPTRDGVPEPKNRRVEILIR